MSCTAITAELCSSVNHISIKDCGELRRLSHLLNGTMRNDAQSSEEDGLPKKKADLITELCHFPFLHRFKNEASLLRLEVKCCYATWTVCQMQGVCVCV